MALPPRFSVFVTTGMLEDDPPHHLSGHTEELSPILPLDPVLIDQLEEGLVDQSGGLQGVILPLVSHVPLRLSVQLIVDHGHEVLEGGLISAAPVQEQLCDVASSRLQSARSTAR